MATTDRRRVNDWLPTPTGWPRERLALADAGVSPDEVTVVCARQRIRLDATEASAIRSVGRRQVMVTSMRRCGEGAGAPRLIGGLVTLGWVRFLRNRLERFRSRLRCRRERAIMSSDRNVMVVNSVASGGTNRCGRASLAIGPAPDRGRPGLLAR
jgi:hypothetical protein